MNWKLWSRMNWLHINNSGFFLRSLASLRPICLRSVLGCSFIHSLHQHWKQPSDLWPVWPIWLPTCNILRWSSATNSLNALIYIYPRSSYISKALTSVSFELWDLILYYPCPVTYMHRYTACPVFQGLWPMSCSLYDLWPAPMVMRSALDMTCKLINSLESISCLLERCDLLRWSQWQC